MMHSALDFHYRGNPENWKAAYATAILFRVPSTVIGGFTLLKTSRVAFLLGNSVIRKRVYPREQRSF
jgi:hypothetical protein